MPPNNCHTGDHQVLWTRFRRGDKEAFGSIITSLYNKLFNYGCRFSKDHDVVKDCMQELFVSLWRNRSTIKETASVENYLFKSLRRKLCREISKSRLVISFDDTSFDADFNIVLPVDNHLILQERLTELTFKLRSIVEKLSKRQQEIIYLKFYMDMDVEQIAQIMSLNRQSVYNLLYDALRRMKNIPGLNYSSFYLETILVIVFHSLQ